MGVIVTISTNSSLSPCVCVACAVLAWKGLREKGDSADRVERVSAQDEIEASKLVAWTIARDSVLFGIPAGTLLVYLTQ